MHVNPLGHATLPNPTTSRFAWRHPRSYLALHTVIGFLLAAACAWTFLAIADAVPETPGRMLRIDGAVAAWMEAHGTERGERVFFVISWLGSELLVILGVIVVLSLAARRSWRRCAFTAITCLGAWPLNMVLKTVFHRARPPFASEFAHDGSFSFPSGHAMESIVVYGALAVLIMERLPDRQWSIRFAWLGLALLIGFSRIYLGVHYLSDVIAGFAAGIVWLFTCVTAYRFSQRRAGVVSGLDGPANRDAVANREYSNAQ